MVKKAGIFDKIVNRFRSGPVQVEETTRRGGTSSKATGSPRRGAAEQPRAVPIDKVEPSRGEAIGHDQRRKISNKEDAALAMSKSFGELSSLLRGVQVRMEDQGSSIADMGKDISRLPAASEAQLELLKALATQLEKQNTVSASLVQTFGDLPEVMKDLRAALERNSARDERTAQTLDQFRSTMDRIQGSMGEMVQNSKEQTVAAQSMAKDHQSTVAQLEESTQEGLKALRWAQEDQANRMLKLASENGRWNRAVVFMLVLLFSALVAIFAALVI